MRERNRLVLGTMSLTAGLALAARRVRRLADPSFAGKVIVITGARGLALELARTFAAEGGRLALIARSADELRRAQRELADDLARVFLVPADIRDRAQAEQAIRRVTAHYGRLDVLVNVAGVIMMGPFANTSDEDIARQMDVHFWGPLFLIRAALPHLRRAPAPRVVNVGSIGGKVGVPHLSGYCASKFALVGLSESLRAELAGEGIRVTTVNPGLMRTGSHVNAWFKGRHDAEFAWFAPLATVPIVSINAERAARKIVEACRRGSAELVITPQARAAIVLNAAVPALLALAMNAVARLLPSAEPQTGGESRAGRDLTVRSALRWVSALGERAARRNNELGRPLPIEQGVIDLYSSPA